MRKHIFSIVFTLAVAFGLYLAYQFDSKYVVDNSVITCNDKSNKQCLLENRKRKFSNQWQMETWGK